MPSPRTVRSMNLPAGQEDYVKLHFTFELLLTGCGRIDRFGFVCNFDRCYSGGCRRGQLLEGPRAMQCNRQSRTRVPLRWGTVRRGTAPFRPAIAKTSHDHDFGVSSRTARPGPEGKSNELTFAAVSALEVAAEAGTPSESPNPRLFNFAGGGFRACGRRDGGGENFCLHCRLFGNFKLGSGKWTAATGWMTGD